jgi:hypothetical protein
MKRVRNIIQHIPKIWLASGNLRVCYHYLKCSSTFKTYCKVIFFWISKINKPYKVEVCASPFKHTILERNFQTVEMVDFKKALHEENIIH